MSGGEILMGASAGMSLVSGVMGAASSVAQGNASKAAAFENARIMNENAVRLDASAQLEEGQGVVAAGRRRKQLGTLRGNSLAALVTAGVDATEGSPLEILSAQASENEFQALQDKWEHDQRAWEMRVQAYDTRQRANMTMRYGLQAQEAGFAGATSALVGGVSRATTVGYDLLKPTAATADGRAPGGGGEG